MAKTKRLKTLTAGRLVYAVCYTQALPSDGLKQRQAKAHYSTLARQALNFRAAWQKLRLLLLCNFTRYDLYITFGYDDSHLPPNRKAAKKAAQGFIDKLRAQRRKTGDSLKYVYNTQELQDDGTRRLHHHLIINAGAGRQDFDLIRSLWDKGDNVEIGFLSANGRYSDDFLEIAQYFCRERNPDSGVCSVGDKCWVSSRNLAKPIPESYMVSDNVTVTAPPGAYIIDTDHKQNNYGSYDYIVYMLPEAIPKPKSRRRIT
ncbi:MAG: hypothetical protein RR235_09490 [Oscillospiraceae bacterium]